MHHRASWALGEFVDAVAASLRLGKMEYQDRSKPQGALPVCVRRESEFLIYVAGGLFGCSKQVGSTLGW